MDTRLLKHLEDELVYIREMGAEFAQSYPKIASRLGLEGIECLDPYVERLLEGFAFLSARVQLELEQQYPVFTQHLLEIVYPHYLSPIPAMVVAEFTPDKNQTTFVDGYKIPRGTVMRTPLKEGDRTQCEFRLAQDMTFWPIKVLDAEYISGRGAVVAAGVGDDERATAAIRIRIGRVGDGNLSEVNCDSLTVLVHGSEPARWRLHEQIAGFGLGIIGRSIDRRKEWKVKAKQPAIEDVGYSPNDALLPYPSESFDGYRLLQEYFAIPERFLFVRFSNLQKIFKKAEGKEVDLFIPVSDNRPELRHSLDADCFRLFAAPAVNLFPKRCDRIHISGLDNEHHVVADRTAPMDFEIYRITKVTGIGAEGKEDVQFRPFYSSDDITAAGESHPAYYTVKRNPRVRSEKQRLKGGRTNYLGGECFVSLVDRRQAPYSDTLKQLAVECMATNRDLPMLLATGTGETDFLLPEGGPVKNIRALHGPTKPRPSLAFDGGAAWRLISHLSLNYLSLTDNDGEHGAAALRELLSIYAPIGSAAAGKQLEGVRSVSTRPIVRRIRDKALSTAVRGREVTVTFDESFFTGSSAFLMGAVLNRFFAKYVSLNSFTETVIRDQQRGEISRWPARTGLRQLL